MKNLFLGILAATMLFSGVNVYAAKDKKEQIKAQKMRSESAESMHWYSNLNAAMQQAQNDKLPILLLATGSDWCPPCMKLEKEIFSKKEFYKAAAGKVVLVKADFPRQRPQSSEERQQAEAIAKRFKIEAFPTVLLLSSDGKVLDKQVGYRNSSPKKYLKSFKGFNK